MGLKVDAFLGAEFRAREEDVSLPDMADWFDGPPVWRVRGLTAYELARCNEAAERRQNAGAIVEALVGESKRVQVQELRKSLGLTDDVPAEIAKRLEQLCIGSVDPVCDHALAVRLATAFPIEFYQLTNRIVLLTGKGQDPGKSLPSGEEPK